MISILGEVLHNHHTTKATNNSTHKHLAALNMTCVMHADWVAGEGAAAGGKGYTGASGTRRALAWYGSLPSSALMVYAADC